jgi:predicted N-acetyltransferase YhbS
MMSGMRVAHPKTEEEFAARDSLLQASLREGGAGYGIAAEYPLVLGRAGARFSWCGFEGARVVAHINLWPREVSGRRVGLVGNVATDPEFRGRGLMHTMFKEIRVAAQKQGLTGLVLWSDLQEFYQKLGFRSCGRERRYLYQAVDLGRCSQGVTVRPAGPADAGHMLPLRHEVALTLSRSTAEMAAQLAIPDTHGFLFPRGYAVEGRGADLRGVVHEWGAASPEDLLGALYGIAEARDLAQVMLLAPGDLDFAWDRVLRAAALSAEEHPMALAQGEGLDELFVWGLDSI